MQKVPVQLRLHSPQKEAVFESFCSCSYDPEPAREAGKDENRNRHCAGCVQPDLIFSALFFHSQSRYDPEVGEGHR